ncbi:MAG: hypothetical protein ACFFER_17555 [Candidatus Thorarchaeota archaeon]
MANCDRKLVGIPSLEIKTFHVYVCEDHILEDGGIMRLRAASTFYSALAACMLVFAVALIGSDLGNGRSLTTWTALFFTFVGTTMALAFVAFSPYGIETGFKIVRFDFGLRHMWFQLHSHVYRNAVLDENGMDAELVSWSGRRGP